MQGIFVLIVTSLYRKTDIKIKAFEKSLKRIVLLLQTRIKSQSDHQRIADTSGRGARQKGNGLLPKVPILDRQVAHRQLKFLTSQLELINCVCTCGSLCFEQNGTWCVKTSQHSNPACSVMGWSIRFFHCEATCGSMELKSLDIKCIPRYIRPGRLAAGQKWTPLKPQTSSLLLLAPPSPCPLCSRVFHVWIDPITKSPPHPLNYRALHFLVV